MRDVSKRQAGGMILFLLVFLSALLILAPNSLAQSDATDDDSGEEVAIEKNISSYTFLRSSQYEFDSEDVSRESAGFNSVLESGFMEGRAHTALYRNEDEEVSLIARSFDSREDLNKYLLRRVPDNLEVNDFNGSIVQRYSSDGKFSGERTVLEWSSGSTLLSLSSQSWSNRSWEGIKESIRPVLNKYLVKYSSDLDSLNKSIGGYSEVIVERDIGGYSFKLSSYYEDTGEEIEEGHVGFYRTKGTETARAMVMDFESREKAIEFISDRGPGYSGTKLVNGSAVAEYRHHYRWVYEDKGIMVLDTLRKSKPSRDIVRTYLNRYPSDLDMMAFPDAVSIELEPGWNLLPGLVMSDRVGEGQLKPGNISTAYTLRQPGNNYTRIWPSGPDFINRPYYKSAASWVYTRDYGEIGYSLGGEVDIENRTLYSGYNFLTIPKEVVESNSGQESFSPEQISGTCDIEKAHAFDNQDKEWMSFSLSDSEYSSYGDYIPVVVQVSHTCKFHVDRPSVPSVPPAGENATNIVLDSGSRNITLETGEEAVLVSVSTNHTLSVESVTSRFNVSLQVNDDILEVDRGRGLTIVDEYREFDIRVKDIFLTDRDDGQGTVNITVSSSSSKVSCRETDGGKNYDINGTTTSGDRNERDQCAYSDGSKIGLVEYYCSEGEIESTLVLGDCQDGRLQ